MMKAMLTIDKTSSPQIRLFSSDIARFINVRIYFILLQWSNTNNIRTCVNLTIKQLKIEEQ